MNSLLLWIGGLLALVLGLLFAVPYAVDWNTYRGVFEEEATRVLGRSVRVGGGVQLRILPVPYVRFEKVRISDAGAALGEPFFRAESFTLWLSPTPLLRGTIEAHEIELDRPVLRLAVDEKVEGNWQAFKITPGSLPFVPSDVVLQQVKIKGGTVSLRMPGPGEPLTLSAIDGEVAASSLDGPYRFRGLVTWAGLVRELRFATSQKEADGRLRYKGTVRVPDNGNVYALDGTISELTAQARYSGVLTARLPLATLAGGASVTRSGSGSSIDLKSNIDGDFDGVRLSDIALQFEQAGKPQMMSGAAAAAWRGGMRMETRLASRWIDLDLITGRDGAKAAPLDAVRRVIGQMSELLPSEGNSLLTVDIDQVTLGGEGLSGVRLALARAGGLTSIGELRAGLPGNARGEIRGTLNPRDAASPKGGPADAFEGELAVQGAGYRRFLAWAGLMPQPAAASGAATDSPFSIASRMRLTPDRLMLTDAKVELARRQADVALDWRWAGDRSVDLGVAGRAIDLTAFMPGAIGALEPGAGTGNGTDSGGFLGDLAGRLAGLEKLFGPTRIVLRTDSLGDGTTELRDVDIDVAVRGDRLEATRFKVATPAGLALELSGSLSAVATAPAGEMRGWVRAANGEAWNAFTRLLPEGGRRFGSPLFAEGTADFGFAVRLGDGQSGRVRVEADGQIAASEARLRLSLDGGTSRWQQAPIDLDLSLEGPGTARLVGQALWGQAARTAGARGTTEATALRLVARGTSARELLTMARVSTSGGQPRGSVEFNGTVQLGAERVDTARGNLVVDAADASVLSALAGAVHRTPPLGASVRGTLAVTRAGDKTELAWRGLEIADTRSAGRLVLTSVAGRTRIDGQANAGRVALLGAAGLVLDRAAAAPVAAGDDAPSPWPDAAIDLSALDGIEGQIVVTTPRLHLGGGLELSDAEIGVGLSPGRLTLANLGGTGLGGRFSARGTIEAAAGSGGAAIALDGRLTGGRLDLLAGRRPDPKSQLGEANLSFAVTARARSLRAAASQFSGRGDIEFRNARVVGLSPGLVERVAVPEVEGKGEITRAALEAAMSAQRLRSEVGLGNRKLAVEIGDGVAKIARIEITGAEGAVTNTTTLDLVTLVADSEWRIVPKRPLPVKSAGARREPPPELLLVWKGPLASVARSPPRLSLDALEREILARRIEHETAVLEELRRQDEERARLEAERLKKLEEDARPPVENEAPTRILAPGAAPLQVVPQPQPASPGGSAGAVQPPLPTVRAPPVRRPPAPRTLQDAVMGQP